MTAHREGQLRSTINRLRRLVFTDKADRAQRLIDKIKARCESTWIKQHNQNQEKRLNDWLSIQ